MEDIVDVWVVEVEEATLNTYSEKFGLRHLDTIDAQAQGLEWHVTDGWVKGSHFGRWFIGVVTILGAGIIIMFLTGAFKGRLPSSDEVMQTQAIIDNGHSPEVLLKAHCQEMNSLAAVAEGVAQQSLFVHSCSLVRSNILIPYRVT